MSWLLSNWEAIAGAAGAIFGGVQQARLRKAKKQAAELAAQLDAIRTEAGTKAPHELDLSEQARIARSKKKTREL